MDEKWNIDSLFSNKYSLCKVRAICRPDERILSSVALPMFNILYNYLNAVYIYFAKKKTNKKKSQSCKERWIELTMIKYNECDMQEPVQRKERKRML
jgi:hypothetical protein